MHVDTLRILDRLIGVPLCFALTLIRRVARAFSASVPFPSPRKILIIKLSEMGSTVLAYPALSEIKRRCPDAELFFLVFKNNAAIVEVLDFMPPGNIITVDYRTIGCLVRGGIQAMKRLLKERIDTTIDMDLFSRLTALIAFILCRGNRIGFHRYNDEGLYRGDLLTHRVLYSPHIHTSAAFMALVKTLFENPQDEPHYRGRIETNELTLPRYAPSSDDVRSVQEKLADAGIKSTAEIMILINPNSSDIFPLRKWPLANFAQLCHRLTSEIPHCRLVITGVASEQPDARYIIDRVGPEHCVDFTGRTSFRELLALYSLAQCMVTNDSGPAHFASLLALPTLVLFGPETPRLYSPLGGRHKVMFANFACSPCVSVYNGKKSPCQENRCLKFIDVDQVMNEILDWLPSRHSGEHAT
jgi:ADP-heptose:LPS heptosyltransferase